MLGVFNSVIIDIDFSTSLRYGRNDVIMIEISLLRFAQVEMTRIFAHSFLRSVFIKLHLSDNIVGVDRILLAKFGDFLGATLNRFFFVVDKICYAICNNEHILFFHTS